jgi:hypothetical protein
MAFDEVRQKAVLFGGTSGDPGTWEWDGQFWTQVSDMGPSLRRNAVMAWDSASKRVLLFGGAIDDPAAPAGLPRALRDTWEWDGSNWTQLDDTGPSARFASAVAADTKRERVVLFGGAVVIDGTPQALGDTWEWDGAAWTQLNETGPSARSGHCMTFDSVRARTVLSGGLMIDGTFLGDTWEWTGTAWIQVSEFGIGPRHTAAMSFDGLQSVLFGGKVPVARVVTPAGDTWSWDGRFWTQRQDIGPQPRRNLPMTFDSARKKTVLFGGDNLTGAFGDTWELSERP